MQKKRVLVCGASGFIGKNVFERLAERDDLEIVGTYLTNAYNRNRQNDSRLVKADLTDRRQVAEITKNVDVIIQAAAVTSGAKDTIERPYVFVTDNAIMNTLLFQSAHDNKVPHLIFLSSAGAIYRSSPWSQAETEVNWNVNTSNLYFPVFWTKIYLEKLCQFYSSLGITRCTVIRPANIYGPFDRFDLNRSHILGATITKVMAAQDGKVTVWGDGKSKKELLYVSDLIDFIEMVMHKQTNQFDLFNIGSGEMISIRDLVQKVIDISGRKLEIVYNPLAPSIPTNIKIDSSKAKYRMGWQSQITLDEGLKKTIIWFKENMIDKSEKLV